MSSTTYQKFRYAGRISFLVTDEKPRKTARVHLRYIADTIFSVVHRDGPYSCLHEIFDPTKKPAAVVNPLKSREGRKEDV